MFCFWFSFDREPRKLFGLVFSLTKTSSINLYLSFSHSSRVIASMQISNLLLFIFVSTMLAVSIQWKIVKIDVVRHLCYWIGQAHPDFPLQSFLGSHIFLKTLSRYRTKSTCIGDKYFHLERGISRLSWKHTYILRLYILFCIQGKVEVPVPPSGSGDCGLFHDKSAFCIFYQCVR